MVTTTSVMAETRQTFLDVMGILLLCVTTLPNMAGSSGFYADNGLEQSVVVQRMPGRERREMQQEILTLLGLHHRPKPNTLGTDLSAPKYMLDIYRSLQLEDEDLHFHANPNASVNLLPEINTSDVIMSFVNHAGKIHFLRHERDKTFYFDFSEVSPEESATGAQLRLYKSRSDGVLGRRDCQVELYRIRQGKDPEDKYLESEYNLTVGTQFEGWVSLDVTRAADSWTLYPQTNLGLFHRIVCANGKEIEPRRFGIVGRKGPEDKQAFMVGFFRASMELHMRRTRAARRRQNTEVTYNDDADASWGWGQYHSRYSRRACQRRSLFVSFKYLGWQDWIIAPEGYAAFYCQGECSFPLGAHMNATNHAIVQTLVHLMNPTKVPKPCCAPTKLSAISVLYFDDNSNVILKKYRNMAVKACGCH